MASITKIKLKSGKTSWRVFIRLRNLKPITKQFKTKRQAIDFSRKVEGDYSLAESFGQQNDLKITLADVIDEYLSHYKNKDKTVLSRLNYWRTEYGKKNFLSINANTIRQGVLWILVKF